MERFPSLKARKLLSILKAAPLNYQVIRQKGSHRHMEAEGRGRVLFAFHDRETIPGGMVRKILVDQVGLDEEDARKLI
ncbi:MAG TPA: type II toxin-antitoxin system HicA family toxin [Solirubrobacteraceae bacterium]|nr:type II toxin-antitoxin system HicA family toxin [Solirubrobacteraceae bacterium]